MRGHSSHQFNPFLALKRPNADEKQGEVLGFSLVYSGNFLARSMWTLRSHESAFEAFIRKAFPGR
ncbi:MAG: glycoside hydrolase family 36 N-terminal domain-containing protein [Lachnospiraceae bacterium]